MGEKIKRRFSWRTIVTLATFVALAILIYGLRKDIVQVVKNLGKVNAIALALMIPIQVLNYDAYSRFYVDIFRVLKEKVGYWPMFRLNLELNFMNHILPSGGFSGMGYFAVRMKTEGVSSAKSSLSQALKMFLLYASFQPLLVLGVFLLAIRGHTNNLIMVMATSIITLLIVGTFIGLYIIEDRRRINSSLTAVVRFFNSAIHIVRRKHPETINIASAQVTFNEFHDNYMVIKSKWRELTTPFFYMMAANITEIAAVYVVYIAFGRWVNVGAVILAYAVANFAGLISVLPAGIGVYEALMTAVLVVTGIPADLSIPVTIMYRVINMAIQLTPGYILYQRAVGNSKPAKA